MGDIESMVSIQSVSKVFTLAKVIDEQEHQFVQNKIGVDATGEVFNSIVAVERNFRNESENNFLMESLI